MAPARRRVRTHFDRVPLPHRSRINATAEHRASGSAAHGHRTDQRPFLSHRLATRERTACPVGEPLVPFAGASQGPAKPLVSVSCCRRGLARALSLHVRGSLVLRGPARWGLVRLQLAGLSQRRKPAQTVGCHNDRAGHRRTGAAHLVDRSPHGGRAARISQRSSTASTASRSGSSSTIISVTSAGRISSRPERPMRITCGATARSIGGTYR